ncbi:predicted protein [Histoplasma capsulatum H143]|uniref:Uncharacterized protein n=1 Tax=Ajellomyces capsulatus (strain H143) TaxID=544712 RepID=C6HFB3_AJECH|nr:predicted protein [Histoplasma capsulatum H143]
MSRLLGSIQHDEEDELTMIEIAADAQRALVQWQNASNIPERIIAKFLAVAFADFDTPILNTRISCLGELKLKRETRKTVRDASNSSPSSSILRTPIGLIVGPCRASARVQAPGSPQDGGARPRWPAACMHMQGWGFEFPKSPLALAASQAER